MTTIQERLEVTERELDKVQRELHEWQRAVGLLLAAVPTHEIVGVGGSMNDLAEWIKARHKDTKRIDALEKALRDMVEQVSGHWLQQAMEEFEETGGGKDGRVEVDSALSEARAALGEGE